VGCDLVDGLAEALLDTESVTRRQELVLYAPPRIAGRQFSNACRRRVRAWIHLMLRPLPRSNSKSTVGKREQMALSTTTLERKLNPPYERDRVLCPFSSMVQAAACGRGIMRYIEIIY
jgi:hypothetical protein